MIVSRKTARSFSEISHTLSSSSLTTSLVRPTKMTRTTESNLQTKQLLLENKYHYVTCDDDEEHRNNNEHQGEPLSAGEKQCHTAHHDNITAEYQRKSNQASASKIAERIKSLLKEIDPNEASNNDMSPDIYLQKLFETIMGFRPTVLPTLEVSPRCSCTDSDHPFIPPVSEDEQTNYCTDVVTAVRENDLSSLQKIHSNGRSLSCCNRFGESLLHMACRRGFDSIVMYLVQEANVSVRISDDCGRTPLHDGLWHKECQYIIMDLLVRTDPLLLLTCDKRGHTPFAYCRREHWANWRQFLWDRREHMKSAMNEEEMELFRSSS